MINRWYKRLNAELRKKETMDVNNEKPFVPKVVREASQGLHKLNRREKVINPQREKFPGINTEEIVDDDDNRVKVMVSIVIPPSSDHPLYDRYAYEFEKSMGMLVAKCLALSEKFKRNDLNVCAFTITADLFLTDEDADVIFENGRPDWLKECLKTQQVDITNKVGTIPLE